MGMRPGFALLAEVSRTPYASYAELGRRLGVTGEAVRQRLARFEEEGVLRGFSAIPSASVFGRRACDLVFSTAIDLDLLLREPDVVFAVNSVDGHCGVKGYVADVERFRDRMCELIGEPPWQVIEAGARPMQLLDTIDLRILRALVLQPRASFRELQRTTGFSYRTVHSRRQRLIDSNAIMIQPILRPSRRGDLYHNLWIKGPACTDERTVLGLLDEHLVLDRWPSPPSLFLFCHQASLADHVTMIDTLRRTPGIEEVEVVLSKEYRLAEARVVGWIDERLAMWRQKGRTRLTDGSPASA